MAQENIFTLKSSGLTAEDLVDVLKGTDQVQGTFTGYNYIGALTAASKFQALDLDHNITMGPGILLSSGTANPANSNTESSFSVSHGTPGDAMLDLAALQAFGGAGRTYDASVLEFNFKPDEGVKSISFDVIFGSEEYPFYIDSSFVDIAGIFVNGQNFGYINNNVNQPLSVVSQNVKQGLILDNGTSYGQGYYDYPFGQDPVFGEDYEDYEDYEGDVESGADYPDHHQGGGSVSYATEFNGITPKFRISIDLTQLEALPDGSYDIRLAVADTGDRILDSGLFVSNFMTSDLAISGTLQNQSVSENQVVAGNPNVPNYFENIDGGVAAGGAQPDVYDFGSNGSGLVAGTIKTLNNDTVKGFKADTGVFIKGIDQNYTKSQKDGSAVLTINTEDGSVTLRFVDEGFDANTNFTLEITGGGLMITLGSSAKEFADLLTLVTEAELNFSDLEAPGNQVGQAPEELIQSVVDIFKQQLADKDSSGLASQQLQNFADLKMDAAALAGLHPAVQSQLNAFDNWLTQEAL